MRCPNCGNENPDDYTFCDECGAKLGPQEGEASAPGMQVQPVAAEANSAYTPADSSNQMAGNGANSGTQQYSSAPLSGGTCPNCGADTVPGEAYCSECGAELPTAQATGAAPMAMASEAAPSSGLNEAPDGMAMPAYSPQATEGATVYGASPQNMDPSSGVMESRASEASLADIPPTEDTMQPAMPDYAASTENSSMPGVMPIGGAEPATAYPEAMQSGQSGEAMDAGSSAPSYEESTSAAGEGAHGAGSGPWATSALSQLEEAQQAMARGDWAAYGQTMGNLKAFLESVAGGTAPVMPAAVKTGLPPGPTSASTNGNASAIGAQAPEAAGAAEPMSGADNTAMAQQQAQAPQKAAGVGAGVARLVVISSGAELPLPQQEEITVGREDPSSGIFPDIDLTPYGGEDGGVSRRHARLLHINNDYFVEDLQSTNYTKIDGQRLPARVREKLEDGARLDFGRVALIFRKG